jgi:hypothetical protein
MRFARPAALSKTAQGVDIAGNFREIPIKLVFSGNCSLLLCASDSPEFLERRGDSKRCYELAHQLKWIPPGLAEIGDGRVPTLLVPTVLDAAFGQREPQLRRRRRV